MTRGSELPPGERLGTNSAPRTLPGTIIVQADWGYSDDPATGVIPKCVCCPGRHAYSRGADVVESDWPPMFADGLGTALRHHVDRAVESFGDGARIRVTFELLEPAEDDDGSVDDIPGFVGTRSALDHLSIRTTKG